NAQAQKIAKRLFADTTALSIWKRVAAAFVLGQRAFLRAYTPRRLQGPARYEDYLRPNFDAAEKLDRDEAEAMKARYDALVFDETVSPLADPALKNAFGRHALNPAGGCPGDLEEARSDELGDLMLPAVDKPDQTATVPLRQDRGADPSIRRHVRHEIASVAAVATGIDSSDK